MHWPEADKSPSNVAELFKTPGKLRGKTPRTARKVNQTGPRVVCCSLGQGDFVFYTDIS